MPQCGINRECASYYFYTRENYFKHQYKQSYRYSNNQDFDYYKAPHLLQRSSDSAADIEAHQ